MGASMPGGWPADLADAVARRSTRLAGFASDAEWHESVGSTNDLADARAAAGATHGTVIAAGEQTQGRGRLGRQWFSPAGAGLYVSVILRPADTFGGTAAARARALGAANPGAGVTLTAGVALARGLRAATALPIDIKWPNDLLINGRKLCGILAEASASAGDIQHIVLGYGVNLGDAAYPPDIAARATSLERELGRPVERGLVLSETLASLAECLRDLRDEGFAPMLDRWRELSPSSQGAAVEITGPGNEWIPATTAGVADDGALLVRVNGTLQRVVAGEIRWL